MLFILNPCIKSLQRWFKVGIASLFLILCSGNPARAQELFAFTEPASNMAAKSIGIRLGNSLMKEKESSSFNYHFVPEIMIGVSKNLMVHADAFLSNRNNTLVTEGGSVYAKYRLYSIDEVRTHFRLAAYGRYSYNNSDIHQEEINLYGHNSGWEAGVIATKLLHKVALSSSIAYLKALDNGGNEFPYQSANSNAINYTLSAGKLMLPSTYRSYKQTNMNLMLELLMQYNLGSGKYYADLAPSIQFIFNSRSRLDLGYRQQLGSTLSRTAPNGIFLRLEHNFFNVF